MFTTPHQQNVTSDKIAERPREHTIAVVGIGHPLQETLTIRTGDLHAFVELYNISRATPFLDMRIRAVCDMILKAYADKQTTVEALSDRQLLMPFGKVPLEGTLQRFVSSLTGQIRISEQHTYKELCVDLDDIRALPLSKVELFVLDSVILWYRLRGVPLQIYIDLEDGQHRHSRSWLPFRSHSPLKKSTPIRRRMVFSAGMSWLSRLLRRGK